MFRLHHRSAASVTSIFKEFHVNYLILNPSVLKFEYPHRTSANYNKDNHPDD